MPTVTGTENIMMAAVTASGETILRNAAREPEVQDLADLLRSMGAQIEGDGTDTIVIQGVRDLHPASHTVIPDRIEAGTLMIAAAMTRGDVTIAGCAPDHLPAVIEKLEAAGATIQVDGDAMRVRGPETIGARTSRPCLTRDFQPTCRPSTWPSCASRTDPA